MSVHPGLPNGMELTVIAKAHLAVDVLLWLDMSVFLHWLKRSKYPQKCVHSSFFASAKWWVHIILSILRNRWHSKWSQRWERKAFSWRTLPPTPKEIKINQQEKIKEYLQRWQSKSQRSDHNFPRFKYRNAFLWHSQGPTDSWSDPAHTSGCPLVC